MPLSPENAATGGERADAARNRRRILDAAQRLVERDGPEGLSMDAVAAEAGVGVGTAYRRFGDRSGLAQALMDRAEQEFQAGFMHGPPPLGPGAEPAERIRAFLSAYVDRLEGQRSLLVIAENATPLARFRSGAYAVHVAHLAGRLRELAGERGREMDADYLAEALLAPVAADLLEHQRTSRGFAVERIKAGLDQLVDGLASGG